MKPEFRKEDKEKNQKKTFDDSLKDNRVNSIIQEVIEITGQGKRPNILNLQQKYGYSPTSARSYAVKRTKAWQKFIKSVPREDAVEILTGIMKEGKKDSDRIKSAVEILKLTGSYPEKNSFERKISFEQKMDDLKD